jgi:hypothetical protein
LTKSQDILREYRRDLLAKTREKFATVVSQQFTADCTQRKLMERLPEDLVQCQATRFLLTRLLHTGGRGRCNALRLTHQLRSQENFPAGTQSQHSQNSCAQFFDDVGQANWAALASGSQAINQGCRCNVTMTGLQSYICTTRHYAHTVKKQYGLCVTCVKNGLLSREDGNCGGQFTHIKTGNGDGKSAEGHQGNCWEWR